MKHLSSIFLLITFYITAFGQAPQGINYQSVVRDAGGLIIDNQNVTVRTSILEGSINGSIIYQELHLLTTNNFGLVTTVIGEGVSTIGSFANIPWGLNEYFLQTEIDVNGGSNFSLMGAQQLMSVPYALYSGTAASLSSTLLTPGCGDTVWFGNAEHIVIPGSTRANEVLSGCPQIVPGTYTIVQSCNDNGNSTYSAIISASLSGPYDFTMTDFQIASTGGTLSITVDYDDSLSIEGSFPILPILPSSSGQVNGNTFTMVLDIGSDQCTITATLQ